MAPKNKARQQPGNMRSRQQAKLNSQKAQKAPIEPSTRVGPRRQLPPSTEGGKRVGNSSQPWGQQQQTGDGVRRVRVNTNRPQLPPAETKQLPAAKTVPENRRLPGMQGPQPASRPQQPGTSRPSLDRRAAAEAKAAEAAKGTRSTSIKIGDAAKRGKMGGATEGALFTAGSAAIDWYGKALRNAIQQERSQRAAESGQRGRYAPGNQQVKFDKPEAPKKPVDKKPAGVQPAAQQPTTVYRSNNTRPQAQPKAAPTAPKQSSNMDDNYAVWAKANKGLAEKVKAGQSGYDAVQKALGKTPVANSSLKIEAKPESKQGSTSTPNKPSSVDQSISQSNAGNYFNQDSVKKLSTKTVTNPSPKSKVGDKVAQLTPDDRQILRDHAEALKKDGGPAAAKELERLNRMYAKYGMSFGKLKGA